VCDPNKKMPGYGHRSMQALLGD